MTNPNVPSQEFLKETGDVLSEYVRNLKAYFKKGQQADQEFNRALSRLPNYRKVKRTIDQTTYPNLSLIKVHVPSGLNCYYLEYIEALEASVGICERLLEDVLGPYARWLAKALTEPSELRSIRHGASLRDFTPHDIDGASLKIGSCFDKGATYVTVPYKQVFARNKDVETVVSRTNDLGERFAGIDQKAITNKVDEIADHIDKIMDRVNSDDPEYEVSEQTLDMLSKVSYTVATEVEFYGVTAYQMTQLVVAVSNTMERLK